MKKLLILFCILIPVVIITILSPEINGMQALAVAMPAAIVAGTFTALAILFRFTRKFYKRKFNKQKSLIDDESLYLIATTELDDGPKNEALWAKAMALSKGDKEQARYKYIELRVEQLKKNVSQEDDKKNETTGTGEDESKEEGSDSVSYTHLTLPTILLV